MIAKNSEPELGSDRVSLGRRAFLVLGMHRSGTSSLGGTLIALGAHGPLSPMAPAPDNPSGYFESSRIVELDEKILDMTGSAWHDWRSFDASRLAGDEQHALRHEAVTILQQEFGSAPSIVVKDPRICRMMSFWTQVFALANYSIIPLLPIRSPLEVAGSLAARDKFSISKGLILWLRHVLDAEAATRNIPRAIFAWSDFLADWRGVLVRAEAQSGGRWQLPLSQPNSTIERFLSPNLRHHIVHDEGLHSCPDLVPWVQKAFASLLALSSDPRNLDALDSLDGVKSEFDRVSVAFGLIFDGERNALLSRNDAITLERDGLALERDALALERNALALERNALTLERNALTTARDSLVGEVSLLKAMDERRVIRMIERFLKRTKELCST
jgi:hypothetical protein